MINSIIAVISSINSFLFPPFFCFFIFLLIFSPPYIFIILYFIDFCKCFFKKNINFFNQSKKSWVYLY
uniref:Uncharacterized protein n=1 Tax=Myoviridae sp. ctwwu11 TaxID=2823553 RepID=A0A8S5L6V4_9CAUD|nr:MAG TPA: hypothetical protein [Myoviridae sp. ctwwu11]